MVARCSCASSGPGEVASFADDVFAALNRRSKAIRYAGELSIERVTVFNAVDPLDLGRVDISIVVKPVSVRLWVWPDRWIWLDARRPGPRHSGGWVWSQTLEGRFIGGGPVETLEATVAATYSDEVSEQIAAL